MNKYTLTMLIVGCSVALALALTSCEMPIAQAKEVESPDVKAANECFDWAQKFIEWERLLKSHPMAKGQINILHYKGKKQCEGWNALIKEARTALAQEEAEKLGF